MVLPDVKITLLLNKHLNQLEPSGNFICRFKQCYSYESTTLK